MYVRRDPCEMTIDTQFYSRFKLDIGSLGTIFFNRNRSVTCSALNCKNLWTELAGHRLENRMKYPSF